MLINYLKSALRNMLRSKIVSIINIAGLSIGLAVCMMIVLFIRDEISFDRFHTKKEQIFRVTARMTSDKETRLVGITNQIAGPSFAEDIPEIQTYVRMQSNPFIVRHDNEVNNEEATFVDNNFFSVFTFPLTSGDPEKVLSDLHSIVLSEKTALKYFGSTDVIGKTLELQINNVFEPFVVTGVAKIRLRIPQFSLVFSCLSNTT